MPAYAEDTLGVAIADEKRVAGIGLEGANILSPCGCSTTAGQSLFTKMSYS